MVERGWILMVVGGLLSLPFGAEHFPAPQPLFVALSLVLAVGPLLILVGYDALADRSGGGVARSGLQVAGLGLLLLAGTKCASVLLPLAGNGAGDGAGGTVATGYQVAAVLVTVGSLVAGSVLARPWLGVALPLLVGAVALGVTLIPRAGALASFLGPTFTTGAFATGAFAVWAASCVVLGLALRWTR